MEQNNQKRTLYKKGLLYALSCSVLWGVLPIYWQALRPIDSSVIIFYRIFLVGVVCFVMSIKMYGMEEIKKHLKPRGAKLKFFLAGALITANWSIYIWAVNANYVIQTCVGYYIEPLMVSVFGILFFREKLTKYKLTALLFAVAGVVVLLVHFREAPIIALSLAVTFATYAALKKSYNLPSVLSLFYETMYLAIPALGVIFYLELTGKGALGVGLPYQYALLMLCGPLTACALAFFAEAANKVPLVTLGLIEYISPSISLILGIFLFKEPFDRIQFLAFVIVWIGLVFFTVGEKKESAAAAEADGDRVPEPDGGGFMEGFPDRFKFPEGIVRVTAGHGGEALLILGSGKTALLDCGMAYCGRQMTENLKKALADSGRATLDYVLLSHSHYDHIGGLPYVREAFPEALVCGSLHCQSILQRETAKKLMKELGTTARDLYMPESREEISVAHLEADRVLGDGDVISLGEERIRVLETRGHTDCSLSFVLEPIGLLFSSESTGILESADYVHTPILKSFDDALASAEKCRDCGAELLCLPHFGMVPETLREKYWQMFFKACREKLDFVSSMAAEGLTEDQMLDRYVDRYWTPAKEQEQPKEAFVINSKNILKAILKKVRRMSK